MRSYDNILLFNKAHSRKKSIYTLKNLNLKKLIIFCPITGTVSCVGQHLANVQEICIRDIMKLTARAGYVKNAMTVSKNCSNGQPSSGLHMG
jgi:hypothetical protein